MTNTIQKNIISYHWNWIHNGYSFNDIKAIYDKITDEDPFSYRGIEDIQQCIGGQYYTMPALMQDSDYEKLTFIYYNNHGFDGNLEFLEKCRNLEQISIGCACCGKIENLKPLENLTKLKYIDLDRHNISDISSLSKLDKLETLILWGNPIKSIKPIVHLQNLKNVQFSVVDDDEVFELLRNSPGATVTNISTENDESYKAVWINDWAFRTTRYKDYTTIHITVEPLLYSNFEGRLNKSEIEYMTLMKQKAESIAISLLRGNEILTGNVEYVYEDIRFLNVEFEFASENAHPTTMPQSGF